MKTDHLKNRFDMYVADSADTQDYQPGHVPFITSAQINNGIVRYVEPLKGDSVFTGPCCVISGLGFATVHSGSILPKGNGGDSCTVLFGKTELSLSEYFAFAACFNLLHQWRFSFGRKCGLDRIAALEIPWPLPSAQEAWVNQSSYGAHLISQLKDSLNVATKASGRTKWVSTVIAMT